MFNYYRKLANIGLILGIIFLISAVSLKLSLQLVLIFVCVAYASLLIFTKTPYRQRREYKRNMWVFLKTRESLTWEVFIIGLTVPLISGLVAYLYFGFHRYNALFLFLGMNNLLMWPIYRRILSAYQSASVFE